MSLFMSNKKNDHSARDSLLGYFYQIRYALYLILKAENEMIFIEKLDDIDFGEEHLIQVKHHREKESLTNGSPDLWKTIGIWSEHLSNGIISVDENQTLALVTTAIAKEDSIAALLRCNDRRNPEEACKRLIQHAKTHKENTDFAAFLSLTDTQQIELARRIKIIDNSPHISKIGGKIKSMLITVDHSFRDAVYERLVGLWEKEVIEHLNNKSIKAIKKYDIESKLSTIAGEYKNDNLPLHHTPDKCHIDIDIENDNRRFVVHLKMIIELEKNRKLLKRAILHFYCANSERVDWLKTEGLIKRFDNNQDEITRYAQRLIEGWEKQIEDVKNNSNYDNFEDLDDKGKKQAGWEIFSKTRMQKIKIRQNVEHEYIMEGNYHILANEDKVAWHPDEAMKIYNSKD